MNWKLIAFACAMSATVALAADEIAEKLSSAGAQVTRGEGLYRCQVHRGGGRDTRPDNSLETFLWCWGHGVAPEADARLTKDGVAIAFHDPTLQRIAHGISGELKSREIKDMTWNEIKDIDVGSYLGDAYASTLNFFRNCGDDQ